MKRFTRLQLLTLILLIIWSFSSYGQDAPIGKLTGHTGAYIHYNAPPDKWLLGGDKNEVFKNGFGGLNSYSANAERIN